MKCKDILYKHLFAFDITTENIPWLNINRIFVPKLIVNYFSFCDIWLRYTIFD